MQDISNQGSSRLRPKREKGDTKEMHGGRIVRSTGRKDRHSKVCTARGPRDRRVRLSPNTAIQFYDVQDRLGYDRPSKAIDWLMKEAKAAIDALDDSSHTTNLDATILMQQSHDYHLARKGLNFQEESNCSKSACGIENQNYLNSLFSMDDGVEPPSSTDFQSYPYCHDLSPRNKNQTQGLSLSFHSLEDFSVLFSTGQEGLIPTSTPSQYESNSEMGRCQRFFPWNSNSGNVKGSQETSLLNSLPLHFPSPSDQNQLLYQREPLQSSFSPAIRDPLSNQFPNSIFAGTRFSHDVGLSELSAAARIQGQEEQNTISSKSLATSLLHYQN